jgi:serine/threonine-protein phosphatase 2A activator
MNLPKLQVLDFSTPHAFKLPVKKIEDGDGVKFWLRSKAYSDIMTFLLQLNHAMFPTKAHPSAIASKIEDDEQVVALRNLMNKLSAIIDEVPPDPGPRRFGNISFRRWYELVTARLDSLLEETIPGQILNFSGVDHLRDNETKLAAKDELKNYLLGSFGSHQRLDYGTGHELSYLAFIGGLWKLNVFQSSSAGIEKSIVTVAMKSYFELIRKLIKVYNLEPAGSHGVWGLDDHCFLPYMFGSAELSSSLKDGGSIPTEGSAPDAPKTAEVVDKKVVEEWRDKNLYFGAIGFIYDVKKGPFWEHSPMLYDISGVPAGWAKINKVFPFNFYQVRKTNWF